MFMTAAYSYCKANNIDINPEMDTGRGCVDFKFSKGFYKKIVVEIKHSYNKNIIDGFSEQLRLYKKAEETMHGFYVIVDVGNLGKKYDKLIQMYNDDVKKRAEIIYIDGHIKPSASKTKSRKKKVDTEFSDIEFDSADYESLDIEFPEIEITDNCLQKHMADLNNDLNDLLKELKNE
jgi:hypothetical protein